MRKAVKKLLAFSGGARQLHHHCQSCLLPLSCSGVFNNLPTLTLLQKCICVWTRAV